MFSDSRNTVVRFYQSLMITDLIGPAPLTPITIIDLSSIVG